MRHWLTILLLPLAATAQMPPAIVITNRIVTPYLAQTNHTGAIVWVTTNQFGYTGLMESTDLIHWIVWDCHPSTYSNILYQPMVQPNEFFRAYCSTNWR